MAKLYSNVLRETFLDIIEGKEYFAADDLSLATFMLAGKENFKVVFDYLGQANYARFYQNKVTLYFVDSNEDVKLNTFHLDFPLLKAFVAGAQIEELEVQYMNSREVYEHPILKFLLGENLKKVSFETPLPVRYYDRLKQLNNLECVDISCYDLDLSIIPASCRGLKISNIHLRASQFVKPKNTLFQRMTCCFSHPIIESAKVTFVEELFLECVLRFSDFTPENVKSFLSYISKHFPKLQLLNVNFDVDSGWSKIKDTVLRLQPNMFEQMLPNVKGVIEFHAEKSSVPKEAIGKPHFTVDEEDNKVQKVFKIHDELYLNFWFQVHEKN